jgi:hypothetical protein
MLRPSAAAAPLTRKRLATSLAGALSVVVLGLPAGAIAAGSLTTLPTSPAPVTTVPSTTTPTTPSGPVTVPEVKSTGSGGLSKLDEGGIFVAAALVRIAIARIIMRDARSHAPSGEIRQIDRPKGTLAPIDHRLKRTRAKAKRARRARRAGR